MSHISDTYQNNSSAFTQALWRGVSYGFTVYGLLQFPEYNDQILPDFLVNNVAAACVLGMTVAMENKIERTLSHDRLAINNEWAETSVSILGAGLMLLGHLVDDKSMENLGCILTQGTSVKNGLVQLSNFIMYPPQKANMH